MANSTLDNSTSASWPKSDWPKSKLAEVEQMVFALFLLSLFLFFFCFDFTFLYFFLVLTHLSLQFFQCSVFVPKKPTLNPAPHFRWTLPLDNPPPDLLPPQFSFFLLSWGSGVSHDSPRTPNVHISGSRRTTKIPRMDPTREKRKRREKKNAKFGAPHHPSGFHPSKPHPSRPHISKPHP